VDYFIISTLLIGKKKEAFSVLMGNRKGESIPLAARAPRKRKRWLLLSGFFFKRRHGRQRVVFPAYIWEKGVCLPPCLGQKKLRKFMKRSSFSSGEGGPSPDGP